MCGTFRFGIRIAPVPPAPEISLLPSPSINAGHQCPICSYPGLRMKPYDLWPPPADLELTPPYEDLLGRASYEVCLRCGFESGNDDNPGTNSPMSFDKYRREWEAQGSPWLAKPEDAGRADFGNIP